MPRHMPQGRFRVRVSLKPLPPSPLSLLPACSALTPTLPSHIAWRKSTLQHVLSKCGSNHLLGSGEAMSAAWFYFGCEGAGRSPCPRGEEVVMTGGKQLLQTAWGYTHFEGWPKEGKSVGMEYEPSQQMRRCASRFHC